MARVEDGIVTGTGFLRGKCRVCMNTTSTIRIDKIELPIGIIPSNSMILYHRVVNGNVSELVPIERIGVGCGCYARAHRQFGIIRYRRDRALQKKP